MAIKSGRNGAVRWDDAGVGSPGLSPIISLNTWKLSLKTDYEEVTCFGDTNKVYVPGMRDISGSCGGFWNIEGNTALVAATEATSPGYLELSPNTGEAAEFGGLAYLDLDIDCNVNGAPKLTANFRAAGPWTLPTGSPS